MKIRELFRGDIERPIETVIHVDLSDETIVAHEIAEYVVTENIRGHLEELADVYGDTARNPARWAPARECVQHENREEDEARVLYQDGRRAHHTEGNGAGVRLPACRIDQQDEEREP